MAASNVLVLGSQGQVGQSLRRIAPQFEYWGRSHLDLSNIEDVARTMRARKPDTVINLAAYTAVDKAEDEKELCLTINATSSNFIAENCRRYFYVSTDYVYPGTKRTPYLETDATDPINHYGLTKLMGEHKGQLGNRNAVIIRTSWVISEFGVNFVKRMLELGRTRPELSVVNDQFGSPTYAHDLAEVLVKMVTQEPSPAPGIYHYSSEGAISWYDLAAYTLKQAGIKTPVKPIPTSAYPTKARRPAYSVLDKSKIKLAMGISNSTLAGRRGQVPEGALVKVLFTGDYLPDYNRTRIIKAGLKKLGVSVVEFPFQKKTKSTKTEIQKLAGDCDFVFLPSFTHQQVTFVKKAIGKKKLIFDPLISRYLTKVFDYKLVSRFGISALRNYYRDKWSMVAADFVVTDTAAHKKYFHDTFHIPNEKMGVLYIGNDFDQYYPMPKTESKNADPATGSNSKRTLRIGFYGGFIPLQGVMNILGAAEILNDREDLVFELIGSGFEFEKAKKFVAGRKLKNVEMPGWVKEADLPARINQFDIALGIFGTTEKSDLVIPNKIYHYSACARAIITKNSPAIEELFRNESDLIFSKTDPQSIADNISSLAKNKEKRESLGQSVYQKLKAQLDEVKVAEQLLDYYRKLNEKV